MTHPEVGDVTVTERNKSRVERFFAVFSEGGFDPALDCLTNDATWWSVDGCLGRDDMRSLGQILSLHLESGLRFEIITLTAEDDRVAAEVDGFGRRTDGRDYRNQYHFLFRLNDSGIFEVREHCNTRHVIEIWGDVLG